jgi:hypothetical protein
MTGIVGGARAAALSVAMVLSGCGSGGRPPSGGGNPSDMAPAADMAVAPHKRVFVTSATSNGNLGGLAGADAVCLSAATAASLGGMFVAWASAGGMPAIDRITGNGPWGTSAGIVFSNKANLATMPLIPLAEDENGKPVSAGAGVWTGTASGGMPDDNDCLGWTSKSVIDSGMSGSVGATDSGWTAHQPTECATIDLHLYCFEQ